MEALQSILSKGFYKEPNMVYHIYKIRRGKINHVKLWLYVDLGTCRTYDLFVTDNDYKLLNVEDTNIEIILDETEEDENTEAKKEFFY